MASTTQGSAPGRANYGLDAPGVVRTMAIIAALLVGGGLLLRANTTSAIGTTLLWPGASFAASALLMVASSRIGKLRARDRLLNAIPFRGDETVLDVGCGHGLLLIGAAKRVPRGKAIGVDLWSQIDQHANSREATLDNARAEGVADRVTVQDGDMRKLPFENAGINVVVSSLAIHNVEKADERAKAISEIVRVLAPGGHVALLDIAHVGEYADALRAGGLTVTRVGLTPWIFPPTRELHAHKPA